jgi:hypothetical protein
MPHIMEKKLLESTTGLGHRLLELQIQTLLVLARLRQVLLLQHQPRLLPARQRSRMFKTQVCARFQTYPHG